MEDKTVEVAATQALGLAAGAAAGRPAHTATSLDTLSTLAGPSMASQQGSHPKRGTSAARRVARARAASLATLVASTWALWR